MLLALQIESSAFLMGLDALFMSISPRPNFLNPPPVPERATPIFILG
jgi:hypothetical protein